MTTKKLLKTSLLKKGKKPKPLEGKYLVYSYDHDQWQTFVDLVLATSSDAAEKKVKRFRDYAVVDTNATETVDEHLEHALKMSKMSPAQVQDSWKKLKKDA